jgi:hypothetical protein
MSVSRTWRPVDRSRACMILYNNLFIDSRFVNSMARAFCGCAGGGVRSIPPAIEGLFECRDGCMVSYGSRPEKGRGPFTLHSILVV